MNVSIITPALNAASTIDRCIQSVAAQQIKAEHIVVVGSCEDDTLDRVESSPSVSRCITGPDNGMYDAINKGIDAAGGDIIGILNADDYYPAPDVLQAVVTAMTRSDADSCYGDLVYIDSTGRITRRWTGGKFRRRGFLWGWMPPHPTFFVRARRYRELGCYRTDLGSAADYELMLRFLFRHEISCTYSPRHLVTMQTGGISNRSLKARLAANRMDRQAWRVNELTPLPWTTLLKPLRKLGQWL